MADPTRRAVVVGAGALGLLACGGGASTAPKASTEPEPEPRPAPKPATDTPHGGTLFLPVADPDGKVPGKYTDRPEWLRRAPGIYLPTPVTSGAASLCFAEQERWALPSRIDHFRELPGFLDEAQSVGTNVLYVVDVYQGPEDWPAPKWRLWKEHYRIRDDLGGEAALRKAIAAIHARGGKVILYISGFALNRESALGEAKGAGWSIIHGDEPIDEPYEGYYMPCPFVKPWQDHLVAVCRRYAELGADGVHLDSIGNQRNWRCDATDHGHAPGDRDAFNEGCVQLATRVRDAMREVVPEAVVICEGTKLSRLFKGGLDGAQEWGIHDLSRNWSWNQAGHTSIYTAGWSLDDMHQITALGHKWMLAPYWRIRPEHPTCTAWLAAEYPKTKTRGDDKSRRMYMERLYRGLHLYRNAGLLLGLRMPGVDDVTPRRWDAPELFETPEAMEAHRGVLEERAAAIDAALGGRTDLPSAADHLKRIQQARASLSPSIDDGAAVEHIADAPGKAAAYRWAGPRPVVAVVNVSDDPVALDLGGKAGKLVDAVSGKKVDRGAPCPAHTLQLLHPA